jgi:putative membrane protein
MPPTYWMQGKLLAVVLALGYHHLCARHLRFFESGAATHSHIWYRWFNEAPVLLLVAAVVLVVVKPF